MTRRGPDPSTRFKNLGVVTTPYGGKTRYEDDHPAVDIANVKGTPIPATTHGYVEKVDSGHKPGENNFGNSVTIRDAAGNRHQYNHLLNISVRPGQLVRKGHQVGTMGNTGSAYSPSGKGDGTHLDYRIVSAYGKRKNPMTYLKNL